MSLQYKIALFTLLLTTGLTSLSGYAQTANHEIQATGQVAGTYEKLVRQLQGSSCLPEIRGAAEKALSMFADLARVLKAAATRKATKAQPYLLSMRPLPSLYEDNKELIQEIQQLMIRQGVFLVDYAPADAFWDKNTPATVYHTDPVGAFVLLRMNDQVFLLDRNFPEMAPAGPSISDLEHYSVQYTPMVIRGQKLGRVLVSARLPGGSFRAYEVIMRVAFLTDEVATSPVTEIEQAREIAKQLYPEMQTLLPITCPEKPPGLAGQ